jgi:lactoylglutathione lyase
MHLGSIYLIVNDFEKSRAFYEKTLEVSVTSRNMDRFVQLPNTRKILLNFWDKNLWAEYERIKGLGITENLTKIKHVFNFTPSEPVY